MSFINEIHLYKKIFKDIEKANKKCVHLNGAIEYIYVCLQPEQGQYNHVLLHAFYYIITGNLLHVCSLHVSHVYNVA